MNNYFDYLKVLGGGGDFFSGIFAQMDARKKQEQREAEGITSIGRFDGIERLNIPHKYDSIQAGGRYFSCFLGDTKTIYNKEGKLLFECTDFKYYKDGMFLVGNKPEVTIIDKYGERTANFGYALYKEGEKLTEPIFKPYGMSEKFNEFGFVVIEFFGEFYRSCVINKSGEIVYKADSYDHPYLYGVVCYNKDTYTNLLTGNVICKKYYNSTLDTDEFMFIQVDKNCIYQVSKKTGEFIIHGIAPIPKEEPKKIEKPIYKNVEPQPKQQGRNEICNCGSGKKFKHCCINKA